MKINNFLSIFVLCCCFFFFPLLEQWTLFSIALFMETTVLLWVKLVKFKVRHATLKISNY